MLLTSKNVNTTSSMPVQQGLITGNVDLSKHECENTARHVVQEEVAQVKSGKIDENER